MKRNLAIDSLISEYLAATELLNYIKAERESIAAELKQLMVANGIESYESGAGRLTYRDVVSRVVDVRQLRAELPSVAERYEFDRHAMQLRVSA